ncbi:hypothetical protein AB6A40_011212 [Gnathostoma spinigerum]|uniref:Secreted protein n=1 Tax=Gnathostoma spinigerum TaxID=75299 RepID=A0ABD6EX12_9BILA
MYNVRCVISSLLVLLYFINLSQHSFGGYLDSYFYTYNFVPHNFYSLNERRKRDINDDGEENVNEAFRIPSDVEVQNDSVS